MRHALLLLAFVALAAPLRSEPKPASPSQKWEKAIAAFEEADKKSPPPQEAILFIGASGITR